MTELERIKIQFEEFKELRESRRSQMLGMLMTKLEQYYDIPVLDKNISEKIRNSEEFKLYIQISDARDL